MIPSLPFPPIFSCWTQTWLREFAYRLHVYDHWFSMMNFTPDIFWFCFVHCAFIVWNCRRELIITRRVKLLIFPGKFIVYTSSCTCSLFVFLHNARRTRHIQVKSNSVFLCTMTIIFSLKESWKKWEKRGE